MVAGGLAARAAFWHSDVAGAPTQVGYYRTIYYSSLCRLDELVAGVALALLKHHHPGAWRRLMAHGHAAFAAGLAIVLLACWWFLRDRYALPVTVAGFPLLGLGFALLIASSLADRSPLRRLEVPGARALALWSYAIYLTHKQIGMLAREPLSEAGFAADGWVAILAVMGISVLAGALLYRCVEVPFMQLRDRYFPLSRVDHHGIERSRA